MPRQYRAETGSWLGRTLYVSFMLTTIFGIPLISHAVELGFNPALVPNIPAVSPYEIRSLDYDTDGDGIMDYRVVGDFNGNGVLEWSDIQQAVDDFCDPNHDGNQDAADGKLTDLDGDGVKNEPFCGTVQILPGVWTSQPALSWFPSFDEKDDQIWLNNYQGLWLRGSGIDTTILRTIYTRKDFCRHHADAGCGGVCSRKSKGYLTISDFTFEGLNPRSWGKKDCDGDGLDYDNPLETDYYTRVLQTGITIWNSPPHVSRSINVHDIKVTKADYNGFALGEINGLTLSNLSVYGAGATGIILAGIQNGHGSNLRVENVDGQIAAGGITVTTEQVLDPKYGGQMTRNLTLDDITSVHNHMGIQIVAQGVGGITDLSVTNFHIIESRDATGLTATEYGIRMQDSDCVWDANGDGIANEPCYVTNVTFDGGEVKGCPNYGFSALLKPNGPDRNYVIRNTSFEGNGYGIGTNDSRDVDLTWVPGTLFENNTVIGTDYNHDGIPDVTHLIRAQSDRLNLRNNTIRGEVAPGVNALVYIRQANDVSLTGNTLDCISSVLCNPIVAYADTNRALIEGNTISMNELIGVGITMNGADALISDNRITGGQYGITSAGNGNQITSNEIDSNNLSPSGYGIRFLGTNGSATNNTCTPLSSTKYCIVIEATATGTVLQNNQNLTNPLYVYLDKRFSAIPFPATEPPPDTSSTPDPATSPTPSGSSANSTSTSSSGAGGCSLVKTGNFDPTFMLMLFSAFACLIRMRFRPLSRAGHS